MFKIEDALLTFSLKKAGLYISSTEGFLIFGEVKDKRYSENAISFASFELTLIFETLVELSKFFADESILYANKKLIKVEDEHEYVWEGKALSIHDKTIKVVFFYVCTNNSTSSFFLEIQHVHTLIKAISLMYITTLNLKEHEKFLLQFIAKQDPLKITEAMKDEKAFVDLITKISFVYKNKSNIFEMNQLFIFYFEEIVIISKLSCL